MSNSSATASASDAMALNASTCAFRLYIGVWLQRASPVAVAASATTATANPASLSPVYRYHAAPTPAAITRVGILKLLSRLRSSSGRIDGISDIDPPLWRVTFGWSNGGTRTTKFAVRPRPASRPDLDGGARLRRTNLGNPPPLIKCAETATRCGFWCRPAPSDRSRSTFLPTRSLGT